MNDIYKFDAIIIGAGIIGLSIAHKLCQHFDNILLIEKEKTFGSHISSRNSEVIHSGIYYPTDSLKAKLCVRGNKLMYEFAEKYDIKYKHCGKIVVTSDNDDSKQLHSLMKNGELNGVEGLELITGNEVSKREPLIKALEGLAVPSTGIIDSHGFMHKLEYLIQSSESAVIYNTEVTEIDQDKDSYTLTLKNLDYKAKSNIIINSSGLWCDTISKMVGITDYQLHICKGEYYKTSLYRNQLSSLIYPLPTEISLGTHIVLHLDGTIGFGPNAYYVDEIDYNMDDSHKQTFLSHINKYMDLPEDALTEDFTGIRPKIQAPGEPSQDFIIVNEKEKGYPNFINLIGIESPGLTCSLAIGEYVQSIIN